MAEIEDNSGSAFRSVGTSLCKVRNFNIKKLDRVDIILKIENDFVVRSAPRVRTSVTGSSQSSGFTHAPLSAE